MFEEMLEKNVNAAWNSNAHYLFSLKPNNSNLALQIFNCLTDKRPMFWP